MDTVINEAEQLLAAERFLLEGVRPVDQVTFLLEPAGFWCCFAAIDGEIIEAVAAIDYMVAANRLIRNMYGGRICIHCGRSLWLYDERDTFADPNRWRQQPSLPPLCEIGYEDGRYERSCLKSAQE